MQALVTGGAGFLGSNLVDRLLAEGHSVDVVDDLSAGSLTNLAEARASGGPLRVHQLDVNDAGLVELVVRRQPEVVYHLASDSSASKSLRRPVADADQTLMGSLRVLEAARSAGAAKIVVALSGADLYGDLVSSSLPADETDRGCLCSPLGASSRSLLEYLTLFRDRDALEFSALAIGEVYGARAPSGKVGSVRDLVECALLGVAGTVLGDGSSTRDYVYVDDVIDAMSRASSRGSGLLLNVGTGISTSALELSELVAASTGSRHRPHFAPWPDGEVRASSLDPARAAIHLGWKPWTTLVEGLVSLEDVVRVESLVSRDRVSK